MLIARTVWLLLARMSFGARGWLGSVVVLEVAARLLIVATALLIARGGVAQTTAAGVACALVFALLRTAQAFARVRVQRDIYAMTSRAVLASDVMNVPTAAVRRVVLDGSHHAIQLAGQMTPSLAANLIATLAITPLIVITFPTRLLVVATIAVVVIALVAGAVRVLAQRLEQRSFDAYDEVMEALLGSIEGRVEIVARAGEAELAQSFERQLAEYEARVRSSGIASALLGRAPLAAGALAIFVVVAVDGASRSALEGAILAEALLLVACLPPIHGLLLGAHGMVRSLVYVRPLIELLTARPRPDVTNPGAHVVSLPGPVRGEEVAFAYAAAAEPVLRDVSFEWLEGEPLVLTGPNGSGKSTLFKLLLGLRPLAKGRIRYGGHELGSFDVRALRREVAYLPQRPYLGEAYSTVRASMRLVSRDATDDKMRTALARTGVLEPLREHQADELATPIGELSAGQRQRVALARILLQDARIILLDEPDANLDRDGIALVGVLVKELCASGKMVAIAAHSPELAALSSRRVDL